MAQQKTPLAFTKGVLTEKIVMVLLLEGSQWRVCFIRIYKNRQFARVFDLLIGLHSHSLVQSNILTLLNTNSLSLVCISQCSMWFL